MAKVKEIIKTRHGSHLYGLNHKDSDEDFYEVYDYNFKTYRSAGRKQSAQKVIDNVDTTRVSLGRFTDFCVNGVPQALEVLFSPPDAWIYVDESWTNIIQDITTETWANRKNVKDRYLKTAYNFMVEDDFKKNRHSFRLLFNIKEYLWHKRFSPRLEQHVIDEITFLATLPWERRQSNFHDRLTELI